MIDKNDVKMPQRQDDLDELLSSEEKVNQIENLLDLVNSADNRQELRLGDDYYSKFHWFGADPSRTSKSFFSYQEEAVYDFIFNLNKSGILSDQVGMGKTIEAGMIISELASRNELRSLLIIVPNEIMAQKWEYELSQKFGINEYVRETEDGKRQEYPQVKALANYDDFCLSLYECFAEEMFSDFYHHKFSHKGYKSNSDKPESLADVLVSFIQGDIKKAVSLINEGFADSDLDVIPQVEFNGEKFKIKGTEFERSYSYDRNGSIAEFVGSMGGMSGQKTESAVNNTRFNNRYEKMIKQELKSLFVLLGDYFTTLPGKIEEVAHTMSNRYPFLVVPIAYSDKSGENVVLKDFLNRTLSTKFENYKHKYFNAYKDKDGKDVIDMVCEDYRIIDFFIDVGYQTLIVDEVHDYIDVSSKIERNLFHIHKDNKFPSKDYNRYELFDDYYFIKKSSLYKKLKQLADKANRKIFLTATPIKSDMVDFYLLTLLASNKDAEAYKKLSKNLENAYPSKSKIDEAVEGLCDELKMCIDQSAAKHFCNFSSRFFAHEIDQINKETTGRMRYPYFNNDFLRQNVGKPAEIKKYLFSHLNYMTVEEIFLELILAYNAEKKADDKNYAVSGFGIKTVVESVKNLLAEDMRELDLQTRVVFRAILNNPIKIRFEEDFNNDGKPIKRIRELLELEDGPRRWFKTYKKYGIRHTRHQTYNLSDCESLNKLNKNKVERYKNLPVWPRRNGKVLYLLRDDMFFDSFLKVRRERRAEADKPLRIEDLPNYEHLNGNEEEQHELFESAVEIFDYINESMSGGNGVNHEPQSNIYESVYLDDSGMNDYKLALVSRLMLGSDKALGSVKKKVLLFAEKGRDEIVEWFRYQKCAPLYKRGEALDPVKASEFAKKWQSYGVGSLSEHWQVSESTDDIDLVEDNLLVIIDPKRYEKGVDLQKADTIINFDINYDPLKMEQRIGRIDRIRPSGHNQEINIISFVPFNDMSGFVINFFANEMKMFTQWMGETTGIVSVPDEENKSKNGEDVSFEGKVNKLEKFYKDIYSLCTKETKKTDFNNLYDIISGVAKTGSGDYEFINRSNEYSEFFATDAHKTAADFGFLQQMRGNFDKAFRNSISPRREGNTVAGKDGARVVRFNSTLGVFGQCGAESCSSCRNYNSCKNNAEAKHNIYADFCSAVNGFFNDGKNFYDSLYNCYLKAEETLGAGGSRFKELLTYLDRRQKEFNQAQTEVNKLLPKASADPFTMKCEDFNKIFAPVKKLFWDDVVSAYINNILAHFYKQCDNVLSGAKVFEKFIKSFSIADFMSNMEGTYNG